MEQNNALFAIVIGISFFGIVLHTVNGHFQEKSSVKDQEIIKQQFDNLKSEISFKLIEIKQEIVEEMHKECNGLFIFGGSGHSFIKECMGNLERLVEKNNSETISHLSGLIVKSKRHATIYTPSFPSIEPRESIDSPAVPPVWHEIKEMLLRMRKNNKDPGVSPEKFKHWVKSTSEIFGKETEIADLSKAVSHYILG